MRCRNWTCDEYLKMHLTKNRESSPKKYNGWGGMWHLCSYWTILCRVPCVEWGCRYTVNFIPPPQRGQKIGASKAQGFRHKYQALSFAMLMEFTTKAHYPNHTPRMCRRCSSTVAAHVALNSLCHLSIFLHWSAVVFNEVFFIPPHVFQKFFATCSADVALQT